MLDTVIGLFWVGAAVSVPLWYVGHRIAKKRKANYREHCLRRAAEYAKAYAQATWETRTSGPHVDEMTGETFEESIARRRFQSEEEAQIYRDTFHDDMAVRVKAMAIDDAKRGIYAASYGGGPGRRRTFRHENLLGIYEVAYRQETERRTLSGAVRFAAARLSLATVAANPRVERDPENPHEPVREAIFDAFRGTRTSTERLDRVMRSLGWHESAGGDEEAIVGDPATAVTADLARELPRADLATGGFTGRPSGPDLFAILSPGREERTVVIEEARALRRSNDPAQRARDRSRARVSLNQLRNSEPEQLEASYRWPEEMPPYVDGERLMAEVRIRPAGFSDVDKVPWTMCGHVMTDGYSSPNLDQQTLRSMYNAAKAAKADESASPAKSDQPPARRLRRRPDDV